MKNKKRAVAALCAGAMLLACGCAPKEEKPTPNGIGGGGEEVRLTLWTYPVGGWSTKETVSSLLSAFHNQNPDIRISIKTLDYDTGDKVVEDAIKTGELPDLVLEGPERLVANWGARGLMADISDLFEDDISKEIYPSVKEACRGTDGKYYVYPICMTTHCMAINADLFKEAGAWQYIDEEHRTWTTENFVKAVQALKAYGMEEVAAVYCGGQGGDQGTRALVNNLYGGTFADAAHQKYTVDSEENIRALQLLKDLDGVKFDPELVGSTEVEKFCNGELAMAFCWNVFMEVSQIVDNPNLDFDILPMTFPTDGDAPVLQGGIWGFGVFDHKDQARLEAAKKFIRFMTADDEIYSRAVLTSTYWSVREMPDLYVNDELMKEYSMFTQYLGDFYQVTPNWAQARTSWWNMLQRIGEGEAVEEAVKKFSEETNQ